MSPFLDDVKQLLGEDDPELLDEAEEIDEEEDGLPEDEEDDEASLVDDDEDGDGGDLEKGGPGSGPHKEDRADEIETQGEERRAEIDAENYKPVGQPDDKRPERWDKGDRVQHKDGRQGTVIYGAMPMGAKIQMDDGSKESVASSVSIHD